MIPAVLWTFVGADKEAANYRWLSSNDWSQVYGWILLVVHVIWGVINLKSNTDLDQDMRPVLIGIDIGTQALFTLLYYIGWQTSRDYIYFLVEE